MTLDKVREELLTHDSSGLEYLKREMSVSAVICYPHKKQFCLSLSLMGVAYHTNEGKQDIARQVRELKAAGAKEIYLEYEHGDSKIKNQQAQMLAQARAGDTVIVLEVSRLARSTQQLCEIIDLVREKHLRLVIVGSITLDCRSGQADPNAPSKAFPQSFFGTIRRIKRGS